MKIFDFNHCLALKSEGIQFFAANFCKKQNEDIVIFHPFKTKTEALSYLENNNDKEPFIIELNEDLKNLTNCVSGIKIFLNMQ